ncbi:unnamed protein product [Larinioides sclopetarius]|uniref:Uncharacterized protein n=1 Tax=Larinioides sclopetarius TaxID=280406 RepID=A0AAV2BCW9_9ARAC
MAAELTTGPRGLHGRRTDYWARTTTSWLLHGRRTDYWAPRSRNSSSCSDDGARGRDGRRTDDRPHGRDDPFSSEDGAFGRVGRRSDDGARGRDHPFSLPTSFMNPLQWLSCSDDGASG